MAINVDEEVHKAHPLQFTDLKLGEPMLISNEQITRLEEHGYNLSFFDRESLIKIKEAIEKAIEVDFDNDKMKLAFKD